MDLILKPLRNVMARFVPGSLLPTIFAPLKSHLEQTEKGPTKTTTMLNVNRNINSRITRKLQSGPAQRLWYGVFLRAWIHSSMSKNVGRDQKSASRHLEWLKACWKSKSCILSWPHAKLYVYVLFEYPPPPPPPLPDIISKDLQNPVGEKINTVWSTKLPETSKKVAQNQSIKSISQG